MLIDTHCHLYKEYYENINNIIEISKKNGVSYYISNGCDTKSNQEVLQSTEEYQNLYGALGIHPEMVDSYTKQDLEYIKDHINNPKIVAIGEIGLDYYYTKDNKEKQIELFESQLSLAEKYNMPVIIHSREAIEDTINILKKYNVNGIIHSFSGSLETAKIYIKMGFLLGINGVVTFKNCKLKETLKNIPLEYIVLETDSPYLTPVPFRGKQNNPSHILDIAKFIAEIYEIPLEELIDTTTYNVKKMFKKMTIE